MGLVLERVEVNDDCLAVAGPDAMKRAAMCDPLLRALAEEAAHHYERPEAVKFQMMLHQRLKPFP